MLIDYSRHIKLPNSGNSSSLIGEYPLGLIAILCMIFRLLTRFSIFADAVQLKSKSC